MQFFAGIRGQRNEAAKFCLMVPQLLKKIDDFLVEIVDDFNRSGSLCQSQRRRTAKHFHPSMMRGKLAAKFNG
jgi:hypothetical protein